MERIGAGFFERDPVTCARELIGCVFEWQGCTGKIVETEAYAAEGDEACHTWNRPGARYFVASQDVGTAYVYLNYGVHWLFNILTKSAEGDGFVLFRALEPLSGIPTMRGRRGSVKEARLCAGPGCLTKALGIDGRIHGADFLEVPDRGLWRGVPGALLSGPRIGISRAVERSWRFGEAGSASLSRNF